MKQYQKPMALGLAGMGLALTMGAAQAADDEATGSWTGDAELGFVLTEGNTETQNINGKLDFTQDLTKWRNNFKLEGMSTSEDEQTSAEKYLASWKSDYKVSELNFFFVTAQYEDDRFSGFDYQATVAVGYGRTVIKNDRHNLDLEIGPGFRRNELENGDTEDETIVKSAAKYRWKISESAKFSQDVIVDAGDEATISKSITALKSQVNGRLAMKASYTVKHTSEVPEGTKKTDRETALTLVYTFK